MKEDKDKKPSKVSKAIRIIKGGIASVICIIILYCLITDYIPSKLRRFRQEWDWHNFWFELSFWVVILVLYVIWKVIKSFREFIKSYKELKVSNEYLHKDVEHWKNKYYAIWAETEEGRKAIKEYNDHKDIKYDDI